MSTQAKQGQERTDKPKPEKPGKPKFHVDIEGTIYDWDRETITVADLRGLAGLPDHQQMLEVDLEDGSERTLDEDEIIELKPGKGFAKKVRFKRG